MSKLTVTYKIKTKRRKSEKKPDSPPVEKPGTRPVSRAARMLALAHFVERLVEEGVVRSYADAARQLGVTRARITQITNLLNLSPQLQQALLLGDLHLSERRIRALGARGQNIPTRLAVAIYRSATVPRLISESGVKITGPSDVFNEGGVLRPARAIQ